MNLQQEVVPSVVLQLALVLVGAVTLDGGGLLRIFAIAAIAYWAGVAAIVLRSRRRPMSRLDRLLLRWGYLPAVALAWGAAGLIW